jgi:hypothetical protein
MVDGKGAGRDEGAVSAAAASPEAIFFKRSRSFWDMYSKTDRGAEGKGVSPNREPRYFVSAISSFLRSIVDLPGPPKYQFYSIFFLVFLVRSETNLPVSGSFPCPIRASDRASNLWGSRVAETYHGMNKNLRDKLNNKPSVFGNRFVGK